MIPIATVLGALAAGGDPVATAILRAPIGADLPPEQEAEVTAVEREIELRGLRAELALVRDAAQALVDALPKCDVCPAPATRAFGRLSVLFCDIHGTVGSPIVPQYKHASALRALVAVLETEPR